MVLVIGSRNSSNSRRLVETARGVGRPAYLVDDANEVRPEWLAGKQTVLITAGASAPEHLVRELVDRLIRDHGAQVEMRQVADEDVSFSVPRSLRVLEGATGR